MLRLNRKSSLSANFMRNIAQMRQGPSTSKRSHYEVLGVSKNATSAEIRSAFLQLSKQYHPDVSKDDKSAHEQFIEISEAYTVLSKPETRREYDASLTSGQKPDHYQGTHQPKRDQPVDPIDELYRRYFYELYRRRYPRPSQRQQQYYGQRKESPFRDFRYDRPVWPEQEPHDQQWRPGGPIAKPGRMGSAFLFTIVRLYVTIILLSIVASAIFGISGMESDRHRRPPFHWGNYGEIDPELEERWKNTVITTEKRPEEKDDQRKTDDRHKG